MFHELIEMIVHCVHLFTEILNNCLIEIFQTFVRNISIYICKNMDVSIHVLIYIYILFSVYSCVSTVKRLETPLVVI